MKFCGLENEQNDKAMAAMGIAQNLKEETVVVARGGGSKSVRVGPAQAARQGILAGDSKAKVRYLGEPLDLAHVLRRNHTGRTAVRLVRFCKTKR